ncbi:MAG: adenylate/guanylate cyclase domain-containing protein, partial [Rhodospirillaceae bacterium]
MQATLSRLSKIMLGCGGSKKLPDRIRADVETQQIQSERLIAWIQAGIVLFFGVFYTLSPKTSGDTAFMPVPWVLGVYAGFTLFRLWLLYRDFAPR